MTDLRAKLIEAMARAQYGAIVNGTHGLPGSWEESAHQELWRIDAEAALDAILDTLTENADSIPAIITQHVWRCPNCGTDHGGEGCDQPLPVLWSAFKIEDLIAALRPSEGE